MSATAPPRPPRAQRVRRLPVSVCLLSAFVGRSAAICQFVGVVFVAYCRNLSVCRSRDRSKRYINTAAICQFVGLLPQFVSVSACGCLCVGSARPRPPPRGRARWVFCQSARLRQLIFCRFCFAMLFFVVIFVPLDGALVALGAVAGGRSPCFLSVRLCRSVCRFVCRVLVSFCLFMPFAVCRSVCRFVCRVGRTLRNI